MQLQKYLDYFVFGLWIVLITLYQLQWLWTAEWEGNIYRTGKVGNQAALANVKVLSQHLPGSKR
jgi:hypothetical protein